jgi:hypothetical protein
MVVIDVEAWTPSSVLERAGIVMSEKVGRVRTYQLASDALVPLNAWIVARRRPQDAQLDRLGDYLTRHPKTTPHSRLVWTSSSSPWV